MGINVSALSKGCLIKFEVVCPVVAPLVLPRPAPWPTELRHATERVVSRALGTRGEARKELMTKRGRRGELYGKISQRYRSIQ